MFKNFPCTKTTKPSPSLPTALLSRREKEPAVNIIAKNNCHLSWRSSSSSFSSSSSKVILDAGKNNGRSSTNRNRQKHDITTKATTTTFFLEYEQPVSNTNDNYGRRSSCCRVDNDNQLNVVDNNNLYNDNINIYDSRRSKNLLCNSHDDVQTTTLSSFKCPPPKAPVSSSPWASSHCRTSFTASWAEATARFHTCITSSHKKQHVTSEDNSSSMTNNPFLVENQPPAAGSHPVLPLSSCSNHESERPFGSFASTNPFHEDYDEAIDRLLCSELLLSTDNILSERNQLSSENRIDDNKRRQQNCALPEFNNNSNNNVVPAASARPLLVLSTSISSSSETDSSSSVAEATSPRIQSNTSSSSSFSSSCESSSSNSHRGAHAACRSIASNSSATTDSPEDSSSNLSFSSKSQQMQSSAPLQLADLPYFHDGMDSNDATACLSNQRIGSFLLRPSSHQQQQQSAEQRVGRDFDPSTSPMCTLSVKNDRGIVNHIRIYRKYSPTILFDGPQTRVVPGGYFIHQQYLNFDFDPNSSTSLTLPRLYATVADLIADAVAFGIAYSNNNNNNNNSKSSTAAQPQQSTLNSYAQIANEAHHQGHPQNNNNNNNNFCLRLTNPVIALSSSTITTKNSRLSITDNNNNNNNNNNDSALVQNIHQDWVTFRD